MFSSSKDCKIYVCDLCLQNLWSKYLINAWKKSFCYFKHSLGTHLLFLILLVLLRLVYRLKSLSSFVKQLINLFNTIVLTIGNIIPNRIWYQLSDREGHGHKAVIYVTVRSRMFTVSPNWRLPTMCRSVLVDHDLEGRALALAPFVRWSLSHLLMWFRRPVAPLGSRIVGYYLDCEWWPITLSDGGITTIISIYCKDRRGISMDPRGERRPGAESEVYKRFLGCQSDVHQTNWISPTSLESEGTQVFIAFWVGGRAMT